MYIVSLLTPNSKGNWSFNINMDGNTYHYEFGDLVQALKGRRLALFQLQQLQRQVA